MAINSNQGIQLEICNEKKLLFSLTLFSLIPSSLFAKSIDKHGLDQKTTISMSFQKNIKLKPEMFDDIDPNSLNQKIEETYHINDSKLLFN